MPITFWYIPHQSLLDIKRIKTKSLQIPITGGAQKVESFFNQRKYNFFNYFRPSKIYFWQLEILIMWLSERKPFPYFCYWTWNSKILKMLRPWTASCLWLGSYSKCSYCTPRLLSTVIISRPKERESPSQCSCVHSPSRPANENIKTTLGTLSREQKCLMPWKTSE